jgi:ATP/maltotriose-dependent transcriptional regulator MalT
MRQAWVPRRQRLPLLTRREWKYLMFVALGLTNKEIAARLVVSRTTVRTHLENILAKLNVSHAISRSRAAARPPSAPQQRCVKSLLPRQLPPPGKS